MYFGCPTPQFKINGSLDVARKEAKFECSFDVPVGLASPRIPERRVVYALPVPIAAHPTKLRVCIDGQKPVKKKFDGDNVQEGRNNTKIEFDDRVCEEKLVVGLESSVKLGFRVQIENIPVCNKSFMVAIDFRMRLLVSENEFEFAIPALHIPGVKCLYKMIVLNRPELISSVSLGSRTLPQTEDGWCVESRQSTYTPFVIKIGRKKPKKSSWKHVKKLSIFLESQESVASRNLKRIVHRFVKDNAPGASNHGLQKLVIGMFGDANHLCTSKNQEDLLRTIFLSPPQRCDRYSFMSRYDEYTKDGFDDDEYTLIIRCACDDQTPILSDSLQVPKERIAIVDALRCFDAMRESRAAGIRFCPTLSVRAIEQTFRKQPKDDYSELFAFVSMEPQKLDSGISTLFEQPENPEQSNDGPTSQEKDGKTTDVDEKRSEVAAEVVYDICLRKLRANVGGNDGMGTGVCCVSDGDRNGEGNQLRVR